MVDQPNPGGIQPSFSINLSGTVEGFKNATRFENLRAGPHPFGQTWQPAMANAPCTGLLHCTVCANVRGIPDIALHVTLHARGFGKSTCTERHCAWGIVPQHAAHARARNRAHSHISHSATPKLATALLLHTKPHTHRHAVATIRQPAAPLPAHPAGILHWRTGMIRPGRRGGSPSSGGRTQDSALQAPGTCPDRRTCAAGARPRAAAALSGEVAASSAAATVAAADLGARGGQEDFELGLTHWPTLLL